MQKFFVTGTDTEVGKTVVGSLLLNDLRSSYTRCQGFKPIAAGCHTTPNGRRNSDALSLQRASTQEVAYDLVNPIAYDPAIAPHIAAAEARDEITLDRLQDALDAIQATRPDLLVIEGAGGWRLPINDTQYLSQFVQQNQMPVIIVVGMRLGCLNHAVLTYESVVYDGLPVVGWIANQCVERMPYYDENVATLTKMLDAPLLAEVAFQQTPSLQKHGAYKRLITWNCLSSLPER
ncbi:MAG: dethiobiotin synthase [Pseudomonadota bacterium]